MNSHRINSGYELFHVFRLGAVTDCVGIENIKVTVEIYYEFLVVKSLAIVRHISPYLI